MIAVILYIAVAAVGFLILYTVINMAVRNALAQHYKVVRHFEATGDWVKVAGGYNEAPRTLAPKLSKPPMNLE